jgi:hypothetical protein
MNFSLVLGSRLVARGKSINPGEVYRFLDPDEICPICGDDADWCDCPLGFCISKNHYNDILGVLKKFFIQGGSVFSDILIYKLKKVLIYNDNRVIFVYHLYIILIKIYQNLIYKRLKYSIKTHFL